MTVVDENPQTRDMKQSGFSLSQESITILTVGVALAGLILVHLGEIRADRARFEASMHQMRAEARADRTAFANQITRLVEQQGTLNGLVEGLRHPIESSVE